MSRAKIQSLEALAARTRRLRSDGRRVVFTNGCFDLIHTGHLELLEKAREYGDLLVVGVNSDDSVRRWKGTGRPIVPVGDRSRILAALESVDYVCIFGEDTPLETILALRPDVLVKGADWKEKGVVGRSEVEGWGGQVVLVSLVEGQSTTGLVEKIRAGGTS